MYPTQTFENQRGALDHLRRLVVASLVATLVAGVAAGAVMLSPLSNNSRGLAFHSSVVDRGSLATLAPGAMASVSAPLATETQYSLQISSSPSGSSPSALAGKTVTGGIYVLVLPEPGVTQVRFFMDGLLVRTESFAPFPLAGDNGGVLNPYDTTTLTNGPHTLTAQVDRSGGTDVLSAAFTVANQATPTPTPPAPPSTGCPAPAHTRLINVSTPAELRTAVEVSALPGDKIVMAPGVYNMTAFLTILRDGTQANPIQLVGPRSAILDFGGVSNFRFLQLGDYDGGSAPGANWWILGGFTHRNANFGIALWNSNHNVLCGLLLDNHGQQAIAIKGPLGSSDNVVRENEIRNTGRTAYQYGEGVYVGAGSLLPGGNNAWSPSDRNWIYKNKIGPNVTADHVDIKPTTEGNLVEGNISDATGFRFREVSGSAIHGVYTQSKVVSAELRNNIITNLSNIDGSTGTRAGFFNYQGNNVSYHGNSVTGVGYQYAYRSDGGTGNVIGCDNTAVGGAFSNIPCQ